MNAKTLCTNALLAIAMVVWASICAAYTTTGKASSRPAGTNAKTSPKNQSFQQFARKTLTEIKNKLEKLEKKPKPKPKPINMTFRLVKRDYTTSTDTIELFNNVRILVSGIKVESLKKSDYKAVLYLNGHRMSVASIKKEKIRNGSAKLYFSLDYTKENHKHWSALLGSPDIWYPIRKLMGREAKPRKVHITVVIEGLKFQSIFETDKAGTTAEAGAKPVPGAVFKIVYLDTFRVVILILFILFVSASSVFVFPRLRDGPMAKEQIDAEKAQNNPPNGADQDQGATNRRPYSIGYFQLAFWCLLIACGYVVLFLVTGNCQILLTKSMLGLLLISCASSGGSQLILRNQFNKKIEEKVAVEARKTAAEKKLEFKQANLQSTTDDVQKGILQKEIAELIAELQGMPKKLEELEAQTQFPVSKSWWRDMFHDASGFSFHRFQIFAWTLLLGIVFVVSVYQDLAMPDFDPNTLLLMGFSSGTYLTFKYSAWQKHAA